MSRACPDCREVMQPLVIDRAPAAPVELDRCGKCGGVWFDFGEPEALSKRPLPFEPLADASTTRRCPSCALSLTPGLLPDVTTVEVCTACRGLWFDQEDLQVLHSRALESAAPPPAPRPTQLHVGFVCAKCGKAAQWSEANGTASGLLCVDCAPRVTAPPRDPFDPPDWPHGGGLARLVALVMRAFSKPSS